MPYMDRRWRLMAWLAIGMGVVAIAVPFVVLGVMIMLFGRTPAQALSSIDWGYVWQALVIVLFSHSMFSLALQGRRREHLRAQELAGIHTKMLPAAITPQPANAPEVAREPLQILWLRDRVARHRTLILLSVLILLLSLALLSVTAGVVMLLAPDLLWPSEGIALLLVILGVVGYTRWSASRSILPTGVIAMETGLRWLRPGKADVEIPWREARLLEVWKLRVSTNTSAGFALFSDHVLIEWRDYPPDEAPASYDGGSYAEMQRRQHALLGVIAARTGLTPRTFVEALAQPEAVEARRKESAAALPRPPVWRRFSLAGMLLLILLAATPLAVAGAALTLPLTTSPALNAYVTATTGALGLLLLAAVVKAFVELFKDDPSPAAPPVRVELPPPPLLSGERLSLRPARRWRERILATLVGMLFAGNFYATIRAVIDFPATSFSRVSPRMLAVDALFMIVLLVLIGASLTAAGSRWSASADEGGVHWRSRGKRLTLPWDTLTQLAASTLDGEVVAYEVVSGHTNLTAISWPADARWGVDAYVPFADKPAAAFAAFIARRTGLPLTVAEGSLTD